MIEMAKSWISLIVILGIAFTLIRMITPNTNLKKYVDSMIGVVTVITILTPIISIISKENVTETISKSMEEILSVETMSKSYEKFEEINTNNVKSEFTNRVEEDIRNRLKDKINQKAQVNVVVDSAYNIEKIEITLSKRTDFDIKKYISSEYDLKEEKIFVYKGE